MTLDLPALRKLLADYREWQAGTDPMPHTHDRLSNALVANAPALLRAAEERDALLAAAEAVVPHLPSLDSAPRITKVAHIEATRALLDAIRLAKEPRQ